MGARQRIVAKWPNMMLKSDRTSDSVVQKLVILKGFPVRIDLAEVLRGQGADPAKVNLRESVRVMYEEAIEESAGLLEPAIAYEICKIREIRHCQTVLGNGLAFRSHLVASVMKSAREAALVVCTIGSRLEARVSEYFARNQPTKAVVLDAVGIEAVNRVSEEASRRVEVEAADRGLKASIPINPGMSSMCSLEEQEVVFKVVDAERIGVKLSSSSVMIPLKSISMIVGLGEDVPTRDTGSQCDFCSLRETCRHRRGSPYLA